MPSKRSKRARRRAARRRNAFADEDADAYGPPSEGSQGEGDLDPQLAQVNGQSSGQPRKKPANRPPRPPPVIYPPSMNRHVILDRYLAGGTVNYQPTSSVLEGEKAPMRSAYNSTGFVSYLPAALCRRLMGEMPDAIVFGKLEVSAAGYTRGAVVSERLKCAVTIPSREALNRALDGDMVYVLLDSPESAGESVSKGSAHGGAEAGGSGRHFRAYENWTFSSADGKAARADQGGTLGGSDAAEAADATGGAGEAAGGDRPAVVVKSWRDVTGWVICRVPERVKRDQEVSRDDSPGASPAVEDPAAPSALESLKAEAEAKGAAGVDAEPRAAAETEIKAEAETEAEAKPRIVVAAGAEVGESAGDAREAGNAGNAGDARNAGDAKVPDVLESVVSSDTLVTSAAPAAPASESAPHAPPVLSPDVKPTPLEALAAEAASYDATRPLLCVVAPEHARKDRLNILTPLDTRYPRIEAEANFWALARGKTSKELLSHMFLVQIKGWIPQSRRPYGEVLKIIPRAEPGAEGAGRRALDIARGIYDGEDEQQVDQGAGEKGERDGETGEGREKEHGAGASGAQGSRGGAEPKAPGGEKADGKGTNSTGHPERKSTPNRVSSYSPTPQEELLDILCATALTAATFTYTYPPHCEGGSYLSVIDEATRELCDSCGLTLEQITSASGFSARYGGKVLRALKAKRESGIFDRIGRRDFSRELVYTIDPDTARDFDDAIHLSPLYRDPAGEYFTVCWEEHRSRESGIPSTASATSSRWRPGSRFAGYEVGVHIADTTYYLDRAPELDAAAQSTTTSVYLVDRCCPMLPTCLSNGLCSLNPLVPRYSFSVVVFLSPEGLVLPQKVWFGRGVIVSKARLDYVAAQRILDGKYTEVDINHSTTSFFEQGWPCLEGQAPSVAASVKAANNLARALRAQRLQRGALMLSGDPKRYSVDKGTLSVAIQEPEQAADSHHLIEEFMLVANQLVARRLMASFPSLPIIRLHPPPSSTDQLQAELQALRLPKLETENGATVIRSLDRVGASLAARSGMDQSLANELAKTLFLSTSLSRAEYHIGTSSSMDLLSHWGIHAALYMHFTSPIRRYADDIAHRMLSKGLELEAEARERWAGEGGYQASPEYQDRPHELVFTSETCLYDALAWTPRKALLQAVDARYNATEEFRGAQHDTVASLMDELADRVPVSSKRLPKGEKQSARLAQALKEMAARVVGADGEPLSDWDDDWGEEAHEDRQERPHERGDGAVLYAAKGEEDQAESRASAERTLDAVERDLASIGYSFSALRTLTDRCNTMAKQEERAEAVHRRLMLRLMIDRRQEPAEKGYISSTAYLVSYNAEKGTASFSIPALEASAQMSLKFKLQDPGRIVTEEFDPRLPLELQVGAKQEELMSGAERRDIDVLGFPDDGEGVEEDEHAALAESDMISVLTSPPVSAPPRDRTSKAAGGHSGQEAAGSPGAGREDEPQVLKSTVFELLKPVKCRIVPIEDSKSGNVGVLLELPDSPSSSA